MAAAVAADEDALTCDFAEYYRILDPLGMPLKLAATLFSGLPPESRIKMKLAGLKVPPDTLMLASVLDKLNLLIWLQTEDGYKGRNRPASVVDALNGQNTASENFECFRTAEEFKKRWTSL